MRKRTVARQIALQALYQWQVHGDDFKTEVERFFLDWARDPDVASYARQLFEGVVSCVAEVDGVLAKAARNWSLDRMAAIDRNVLRIGAYELMYRDDIPALVAINEAVDLAKKFSTKESGAFVNGILDRIRISLEEKSQPSAAAQGGS
jgi:3',5'-nucleoside bisphosphate phosphatase